MTKPIRYLKMTASGCCCLNRSIAILRPQYDHRRVSSRAISFFYVVQDTTDMDMPRAWKETAVQRRIGLALLTGSLLHAIAARCEVIPSGPWDRQPTPSADRLARFLNLHVVNFLALAVHGVIPRNYRKIQNDCEINELEHDLAA